MAENDDALSLDGNAITDPYVSLVLAGREVFNDAIEHYVPELDQIFQRARDSMRKDLEALFNPNDTIAAEILDRARTIVEANRTKEDQFVKDLTLSLTELRTL